MVPCLTRRMDEYVGLGEQEVRLVVRVEGGVLDRGGDDLDEVVRLCMRPVSGRSLGTERGYVRRAWSVVRRPWCAVAWLAGWSGVERRRAVMTSSGEPPRVSALLPLAPPAHSVGAISALLSPVVRTAYSRPRSVHLPPACQHGRRHPRTHAAMADPLHHISAAIALPPVIGNALKPAADVASGPTAHDAQDACPPPLTATGSSDLAGLDKSVTPEPQPGSKKAIVRKSLDDLGRFLKTPLGILVGLYGILVVAWGAALVIILAGWTPMTKNTQDIWVEVCSQVRFPTHAHRTISRLTKPLSRTGQVLNGLFTITGIGLIPWRIHDAWHMSVITRYRRKILKLARRRAEERSDDGENTFSSSEASIPAPQARIPERAVGRARIPVSSGEARTPAPQARTSEAVERSEHTSAAGKDIRGRRRTAEISARRAQRAYQRRRKILKLARRRRWRRRVTDGELTESADASSFLAEAERTRLARSEQKFMHAQPWYIPHETDTHRVSPARETGARARAGRRRGR